MLDMTNTPNARRPVRAQFARVLHESGTHVTRVGYAAKITMSDGSAEVCEHSHHDRQGAAIRKCAQAIVDAANATADAARQR